MQFKSRFCKNHSTDTSVSYLTDKILTGWNSSHLPRMKLADLQKALDTINQDVLFKTVF